MNRQEITDTPRSLMQGASRFFSGTLLSRISGMGREMVMAFFFGTAPALAAFIVAFRWANFLRRMLGEGALLSGFVPHFTGIYERDPHQAARFLRDLFAALCGFFFSFSWAVPTAFPSYSRFFPLRRNAFSH